MAATTIDLPKVGIVHIGTYQVLVRHRPGSNMAWLVLLGTNDWTTFTFGYASDPGTGRQRLRIFQSMQRWATSEVRRTIQAGVARLVREAVTGDGR